MKISYEIHNNTLELYFDEKPGESIREALKILGWKWDKNSRCWKNKNNEENVNYIKSLNIAYGDSSLNNKEVKSFVKELKRVICIYTNYNNNQIIVGNLINPTCCNGINLRSYKNLVDINSGNIFFSLKGMYCPRCHKLYFTNEEVQKKKRYIDCLDIPFKTVKIGYDYNGKYYPMTEVINNDDVTYSEKYNKNIKFYLFMRAFVYQKRLRNVSSILDKYGYSLDTINNLYDCRQMNNELFDLFEVADMNELCTIVKKDMINSMHNIMNNDTLSKVYYENNKTEHKKYIVFEYNVTDKMTALFKLQCNMFVRKKGVKEYRIKSDSIKANLKYKGSGSMFSYPLEEDEKGCSILCSKEKFKSFCNPIVSEEVTSDDSQNVKILKTADFLVRSTNYGCVYNKHQLVRINAAVRVKNKNGVCEVQIPAAYCEKCDKYYIIDRYYKSLKRYGYICCKIDTFESLLSTSRTGFSTFQDKGILTLYGYNVNKKDDLSESERHAILDFVIDNGIQTKYEVIAHLENLINIRKNNIYLKDAIKKWEKDISYVSKKQKVNAVVRVDSLTVPVSKRIVIK